MTQDNYVIDTSALIQAYVEDVNSTHARALLKSVHLDKAIVLHIADFALAECLSIIWQRVVFKGLPENDAKHAIHSLSLSQLTVYPSISYHNSAFEIGLKYHLSTYDTLCIALAESLGYPLISDDGKQEKVANGIGISLKALTDFV